MGTSASLVTSVSRVSNDPIFDEIPLLDRIISSIGDFYATLLAQREAQRELYKRMKAEAKEN